MLALKMLSSSHLRHLDMLASFIRHCSPPCSQNLFYSFIPMVALTYVTVQLSLICIFLKLDLDYLCAGHTAPYHSWRNPVESIS